jgi:hypothetical protein
MQLREIIAVCSQILIKYTNAFCREKAELVNVNAHAPLRSEWVKK